MTATMTTSTTSAQYNDIALLLFALKKNQCLKIGFLGEFDSYLF